ncbi:unnamed protein product [Soboliphyme baturini]|uniref:ZP domain-containing protein n=1 Tax=Soboliphyme baturini TaxID=241478 RepID=A0A183IKK6_9BILA|nr:unnamed protein product [Soboliphyme baturini]
MMTMDCMATVTSCLVFFGVFASVQSQGFYQGRQVDDAGIICSEDGITGRLSFDRPFSGKIYSRHYAHVKECVFYDSNNQHVILFAMPNYRCGTVVRRNVRNQISHLENEVYVQFDKVTQTAIDRRYLFVCDESPLKNVSQRRLSYTGPEQTVIIQTMQATNFPVNAGDSRELRSDVQMEILEGRGTSKPKVNRSLKIGDPITLVVRGPKSKSGASSTDYDMTVHSCYAHDGSGANRVELTDRNGYEKV